VNNCYVNKFCAVICLNLLIDNGISEGMKQLQQANEGARKLEVANRRSVKVTNL